MSDHTPLPWKWHPRFEENDRNGSIYSEKHPGHAYAVAMQPRYIENDRWEADASLIIASVNAYDGLVAALKDIRSRARFELNHPSELRDTAFSLIEKTAAKALEEIGE